MERTVTTYTDLEEIVNKYPNSLIATTACIGGELSSRTLSMIVAERTGDIETQQKAHQDIVWFVQWCKKLFGDDFYVECAPGCSREQILVNQRLVSIAHCFNVKMVVGGDAHYGRPEDRYVHEAFLTSKEAEREVASFYEYAYQQTNEEVIEHLSKSNFDRMFVEEMFENSLEIYNKIENFSVKHSQQIPRVEVIDYPKSEKRAAEMADYPHLASMFTSDDKVRRYWVNQCYDALYKKFPQTAPNETAYWKELDDEADIKETISQALENNMFMYPVTLQHYIDMFWACGSTVGIGRGSACAGLNHYLLGVTQLDPIKYNFPFFRYLNKSRLEIGDIDTDLAPSKRPLIISKIKAERGSHFNSDIDDLSRQNLGCVYVATFSTESTKSAIIDACRGYRSDEYPKGIDVDTARYLSSLVPVERGFVWSIDDCINGNKEKDRKPVTTLIKEFESFPGLLDIVRGISGLIKSRGSHASGVIFLDEDPYEFGAFMRTPSGEVITQWDLHESESLGMTKMDLLVTDIQDKITTCIELLQKDNLIDPNLSLREAYNQYIGPETLSFDYQPAWEALWRGDVLNVFQFDSQVGSQAAKKIRPRDLMELTWANGLMRLMTSEPGEEQPMDKYIRFRDDINLWYQEMTDEGLTAAQQKTLEKYLLESSGISVSQEQLMRVVMDPDICGFSLGESNDTRKIVGKKQMSRIPELHQKILSRAKTPELGEYVWSRVAGTQLGYAFSVIHSLSYSAVSFQCLYLATRWPALYWNTACIIVNSSALDENDDGSTNYAKIAKAIGDTTSHGIKVSLIDINKSDFSFVPDAANNQILFGLKGVSGINMDTIAAIKAGRPYSSIMDFMGRCHLGKTAMIGLIKGGAFDHLDNHLENISANPRIAVMAYYLWETCGRKEKVNLQNFSSLIERGLIPEELQFQKKVFAFNRFIKAHAKKGDNYLLDQQATNDFFMQNFDNNALGGTINSVPYIRVADWEKIYKKQMDAARDYLKEHQREVLLKMNEQIFAESWNKYASGTVSAWEMEAVCFYYSGHELANIDNYKYGIVDFNSKPREPEVDYYFKRNGREIPIYKLDRIIGTVLAKNDIRSSVFLLTTTGVVNVKFTKEYYAMFNKQISEMQDDGHKKRLEKGWFTRGTMLMVTGFRREDTFISKRYSKTPFHQLYKIEVNKNGKDLILIHERADNGED